MRVIPDLIEHPDWVIACVAIESMHDGSIGISDLNSMYTIMPLARWMLLAAFLAPLADLPAPHG